MRKDQVTKNKEQKDIISKLIINCNYSPTILTMKQLLIDN